MLISGIYSGDSSWPVHVNLPEAAVVARIDRRLFPFSYGPLPTCEVRTKTLVCACGRTIEVATSVKSRKFCGACRLERNKLRRRRG